jgi:hypothetical protein
MDKVSTLTRLSGVIQSNASDADETAAKSKGWKERLEKLKIKKAEEKRVVETNAGQDLDVDAMSIK